MEHLRLINLPYQGENMKRTLKMKCKCGHWNRVLTDKIFVEEKVIGIQTFILFYKPLKVTTCEKCGEIIASPGELTRIRKR